MSGVDSTDRQAPSLERDVLALLTSTDETGRSTLEAGPGVVELQLVVVQPSEPSGISGWECYVQAELPVTFVSVEYAGKAINVGRKSGEFIVGLADPLPQAEMVRLATLKFFVPSREAASVAFHPASKPSVPGQMIYAAGNDPGVFVRLKWPIDDNESNPVFTFNAESSCPDG